MSTHASTISRRKFIGVAGASAAGLALGALPLDSAAAASNLANPYRGAMPLVFPLRTGTYQAQLVDNWHDFREGTPYRWSHRLATTRRAHDGIDVFPNSETLPAVYAPFAGTIAAVALDGTLETNNGSPPPWPYAADDIYGNFVWLKSSESTSAGYFFFACHLQGESTLRSLAPGQTVTTATALGVMGDTGNATGSPQLHAELHYPVPTTFACKSCRPRQSLTAINPFQSLARATLRS
jgi:murein DD-endopeptidase MepM/ murein hydrolase activator NlpD